MTNRAHVELPPLPSGMRWRIEEINYIWRYTVSITGTSIVAHVDRPTGFWFTRIKAPLMARKAARFDGERSTLARWVGR